MATENQPGDPATEPAETVDQQNGTETPDAGETPPEGQDQAQQEPSQESSSSSEEGGKDPAKQALLADLHKERTDRKTYQAKVGELEAQVSELTTKAETVDAIQMKFDRLEAFLQAIPGPLGKALDSLSFTKALFESDKEISEIISDWNRANPSATSQALGYTSNPQEKKAPDMNALLRSAIK